MALTLPLHFFDGLCRLLPPRFSTNPSTSEQNRLIEHLTVHCSIFDQIRWRRVSKTFQRAIDNRLRQFTRINVRCYNGLAQMCEECEGSGSIGGKEGCLDWHPYAKLVLVQMGGNELGIAVDTKMRHEDVLALVQLLTAFRHSVEQLCMDSPIIELLVSQINRKQMSILLNMLKNSRTFVSSPCKTSRMGDGNGGGYSAHDLVRVPPPQSIPYGPFFSKLKKLTITSQSNQLEHLSRLLTYAVGVDFLYETSNIDLLCLKICIGRGQWSMQKPSIRLFCHVTRFRQWTEAGSLGERYFQQFTDSSSHFGNNGRGGGGRYRI
uniref:F-box domain-containing protein n=1 Tax=Meloidogyne incognita TaxID=6306 RepID=A0A914KVV4_MELIC